MPRRSSPSRRLILPLLLATMLAGEVAGLALAGRTAATPTAPPVGAAEAGAAERTPARPATAAPAGRLHVAPDPGRRASTAAAAAARRSGAPAPRPAGHHAAVVRPEITADAKSVATGPGTRQGRNHVWIPSLGIDRSVESFLCSRTRPPDNSIYRWGCAGRNNVYLLGHAFSVFAPLHDAYVTGRLRKGMVVDYADASGRVQRYAVAWWKVTRPTGAAAWAWAPQQVPSMTLQTCVGADSEYRLMVRLVATD
jgi:hypothetical protein